MNAHAPESAPTSQEPASLGESHDTLLGRTLGGRYRLIEPLGQGGMSSVYLARHVLIERLSAIKVLHEHLAQDQSYRERFLREARAVNRINHPNIVEISDYGELALPLPNGAWREIVYLVMEYVPGETLARILSRERLTPLRLLPILQQITEALSRAHQTGVIHRDLKPENVLVVQRRDGGDRVKLTDFGVAKVANTAGVTDQVLGTPGYVAPEYLLGETAIDGRADLFSLGVLAYEALTGQLPFDGADEAELLVKPLTSLAKPIQSMPFMAEIPNSVAALVMRLLERRPDDRFRDAFALLEALAEAMVELGMSSERRVDSIAPSAGLLSPTLLEAPGRVSLGAPRITLTLPAVPNPAEITPARLLHEWTAFRKAMVLYGRERGAAMAGFEANAQDLLARLADTANRALLGQQKLDQLEATARDFRATLGRAIDHVARDVSAAHRRTLEFRTKRAELHMMRRATKDVGAADALLWEEAAVDDELRRSKIESDDLGNQLAALQDALFTRNNQHESDAQRLSGAVEGSMRAIWTFHRELISLVNDTRREILNEA